MTLQERIERLSDDAEIGFFIDGNTVKFCARAFDRKGPDSGLVSIEEAIEWAEKHFPNPRQPGW